MGRALYFPTLNTVNPLMELHAYKQKHTHTRARVTRCIFHLTHSISCDLNVRKRQMSLLVLSWVTEQVRCDVFHPVKTNVTIQSDLLVSPLPFPKCVRNECFSCQQIRETIFQRIQGYLRGCNIEMIPTGSRHGRSVHLVVVDLFGDGSLCHFIEALMEVVLFGRFLSLQEEGNIWPALVCASVSVRVRATVVPDVLC